MLTLRQEYIKLLKCFILLIIFVIFTFLIKKYFTPFFIIVLLIYLSLPLYKLLTGRGIFNEKASSIISILAVNAILFITIFFIGNFAYNAFINLINGISKYEVEISKISYFFNKTAGVDLSQVGTKFKSFYINILNSDSLKKGAIYTTNGIFAYLIGNIAAYFILSDRASILQWIIILISKDRMDYYRAKIKDINNMIKIEAVLILITTIQTILGFLALGIKNAFVLGAICGILDILPYLGTIFVFGPIIAIKIVSKEYIIALGLLLLYLMLVIMRQVMEARFMSKKLEIHPLLIILSLYIGIKTFGIIGLFMGPLYIICAREILNG